MAEWNVQIVAYENESGKQTQIAYFLRLVPKLSTGGHRVLFRHKKTPGLLQVRRWADQIDCRSYSAYASRIRSLTRSCDPMSDRGLNRAKLLRSPLTEYCRAVNVTLRPAPLRRSQSAKPTSFSPLSGPSSKCSSASASLPGGVPLS